MPSPNSQRKRRGGIWLVILATIVTACSAIAFTNRQYIFDTARAYSYQPSAEIEAIVNDTTMTDDSRRIFFASHPQIEGSNAFNANCERKEEKTAVIGCYANGNIFIYDVTDQRLNGIKEVTAAHEMLHAVYERMSQDERDAVSKLLENEYAKLSADPAYAARMAFYARTQPGERANELHSIIGTEVANIGDQLQAHYAKYFHDRSAIVNLYSSYNETFHALDDRADELSAEIDALKEKIDNGKESYASTMDQLNADIETFRGRVESGIISTQAQYNSERQALQARIDAVNNDRLTINSDIATYRQLVEEYNGTITQTQSLYKSIDSNLTPAPEV